MTDGGLRAGAVIAALELRRRLRDRSLLIQGLAAPLLLAFIITAAFGSGGDSLSATVAVADVDRSTMSGRLVDGLLGVERGPLRFVEVNGEEGATRAVDDGEADAALVVPAGFEASLSGDDPRSLVVVSDPSRALVGAIAEGVARGVAARIDTARLAVGAAAVAGATDLVDLVEEAAALEPAVAVEDDFGGSGGELDLGAYFGPSMAILFLFFTIGGAARSLLAERQEGTLARVRASPVTPAAVLGGKAAATVVLGLLSVLVLWAATAVLLGADWGRPGPVLVLVVATVLAVAGVGAVIAALTRTDAEAESYTTMAAFTLALVGGNFLGPGEKPELLERLSLLTPNGWALRGFTELSIDRSGLGAVVVPVVVLLAVALVCGGLAMARFRRVLCR